jgi:hypothetical protein
MEPQDQLDRAIDRVARDMTTHDAPADLRRRVMARLTAATEVSPHRHLALRPLAIGIAALAVAALVLRLGRHTVLAPTPAPAASPIVQSVPLPSPPPLDLTTNGQETHAAPKTPEVKPTARPGTAPGGERRAEVPKRAPGTRPPALSDLDVRQTVTPSSSAEALARASAPSIPAPETARTIDEPIAPLTAPAPIEVSPLEVAPLVEDGIPIEEIRIPALAIEPIDSAAPETMTQSASPTGSG